MSDILHRSIGRLNRKGGEWVILEHLGGHFVLQLVVLKDCSLTLVCKCKFMGVSPCIRVSWDWAVKILKLNSPGDSYAH